MFYILFYIPPSRFYILFYKTPSMLSPILFFVFLYFCASLTFHTSEVTFICLHTFIHSSPLFCIHVPKQGES